MVCGTQPRPACNRHGRAVAHRDTGGSASGSSRLRLWLALRSQPRITSLTILSGGDVLCREVGTVAGASCPIPRLDPPGPRWPILPRLAGTAPRCRSPYQALVEHDRLQLMPAAKRIDLGERGLRTAESLCAPDIFDSGVPQRKRASRQPEASRSAPGNADHLGAPCMKDQHPRRGGEVAVAVRAPLFRLLVLAPLADLPVFIDMGGGPSLLRREAAERDRKRKQRRA